MERISVQREVNGDSWAAVNRLIVATREFTDGQGLGERQGHRLCIIVEELATNAFDHGAAQRVSLELEMMGGAVRIGLADNGAPYDLRDHVARHLPDPGTGGGAGIALIRAWCEVIDYVADDTGNRLQLVLRLER